MAAPYRPDWAALHRPGGRHVAWARRMLDCTAAIHARGASVPQGYYMHGLSSCGPEHSHPTRPPRPGPRPGIGHTEWRESADPPPHAREAHNHHIAPHNHNLVGVDDSLCPSGTPLPPGEPRGPLPPLIERSKLAPPGGFPTCDDGCPEPGPMAPVLSLAGLAPASEIAAPWPLLWVLADAAPSCPTW